ncbi:ribose-5-phosphate isomerase RpiA [Acuticoccus sp. MNP-M23]|uniref:ribose-5-phosphate isomerase RpiA n=1 Tax=Acuticoccus sp. MNP-M23 TaxID=3072793 RepID=UPI002815CF71|nr:ribose-5-phosphate isomerase RpiA [Acuticoccus sp. MNP-M23]WMS42050.1 ribose-5-phosphate isomerase RpiA [Acuticoccus sp. MNP-M23]
MTDHVTAEREAAAAAAAAMVEPGMRIGLGTGRTALAFVAALGERVAGGLSLPAAVATSRRTEDAAKAAGLAICDMMADGAPTHVDLAIDGADEVDGNLCLIKGGGASLLREKIVAHMAARFVVLADAAKRVDTLGAFPLPVEVVPFGWTATAGQIEAALGVAPVLRRTAEGVLITDNGNYVLDCPLGRIDDPAATAAALALPGVVEHGLFITEADVALIGTAGRVETLTRAK